MYFTEINYFGWSIYKNNLLILVVILEWLVILWCVLDVYSFRDNLF